MSSVQVLTTPKYAIEKAVENVVKTTLRPLINEITDEYGCHYAASGRYNMKSGQRERALLLSDNFGRKHNIGAFIATESMRPLILLECKFIRYDPHGRTGERICHAHSAIRKRYHSIRSSIAILAGSWSNSSLAMMKSHDINIFLIPFDLIVTILAEFGVDFEWGEKEKEKARGAWDSFNQLSEEQKDQIGEALIALIQDELLALIELILDDSVAREVDRIILELVSNLGEVKVFEFGSVEEAIEFLEQEGLEDVFITADSLTLFEPPPAYDV